MDDPREAGYPAKKWPPTTPSLPSPSGSSPRRRNLEIQSTGDEESDPVTLREVLIDMIEERARHNGHAGLIRERIDGRIGQ